MNSEILSAIDEASEWLDLEKVHTVAEGEIDGEACIVVQVSCSQSEIKDRIPEVFKGFRVVIEEQIDRPRAQ